MNINGTSRIFSFPFRLLSDEALPEPNGYGGIFRYRLYSPVEAFLNENSVLEREIPVDKWPSFKWHHSFNEETRQKYISGVWFVISEYRYDVIRVDIWGGTEHE